MIHLKLVIYVELTRFVGGIDDLVGSGFGGGLEEFANGFVFRVLVGADLDAELRISSDAGADGSFDLLKAANLVTDVKITLGIDGENAAVAGVFSNLTLVGLGQIKLDDFLAFGDGSHRHEKDKQKEDHVNHRCHLEIFWLLISAFNLSHTSARSFCIYRCWQLRYGAYRHQCAHLEYYVGRESG